MERVELIEMEEKHTIAWDERARHIEAVLSSTSLKKLVVAGPGTGKTFLFKEALKGKKRALTLTFVNALVEDLSLELYGISEVKTLHGFARSMLKQITGKDVNIFPKLLKIIKEDDLILNNKTTDYDKIFNTRDDSNEHLEFYKERRQYYDYYGYSDIIFSATTYLEKHLDKVPVYDQVVVDEFQDFNKLEISLIDLLATTSPILLAGDDDQALYDFKSATAEYIRHLHSSERPEYESFNLPFCARCTRVVVNATNDLITEAQKRGLLKGRINKPYSYFDDPKKDKESDSFPQIEYKQLYAAQIPWFIEEKIGAMAKELRNKFNVLIISPTSLQSQTVAKALENKGLKNVEYRDKKDDTELNLLDGLKLLIKDDGCNLGWRCVSKYFLTTEEFASLLKESCSDYLRKFHKYVPTDKKNEIKKILRVLRGIRDDNNLSDEDIEIVLNKLEINPYKVMAERLKQDTDITEYSGNPAIRKIEVKATTIQSSKGLAADLVFITHFDDQYFIKNKNKSQITDQDVCNFLVALTRMKKKIYLVSSTQKQPEFLKWINKDKIRFL
jgi:superfamily I DNA/RNA helicase